MVVLESKTVAKMHGFPKSSPDALHRWKRFKKQEAENRDDGEAKLSKKPVIDRRKNDNFNSLPRPLATVSERSVAQEELFRAQCRSSRMTRKTMHTSSFRADSSSDSTLVDRKCIYLDSNDDSDRDKSYLHVNIGGALHLKKPLSANPDNEKNYYEDRGRMAPINWKQVNSSNKENKKPKEAKMVEPQKETIKTMAQSKSQISDEFSNFVENSVSPQITYNKQGNIEKNNDSLIFKIQQRIREKPLDTIQIPAEVRHSFLQTSLNSHFLNSIDTFRVVDPKTFRIAPSTTMEGQVARYYYDDEKLLKKNDDCVAEGTNDQVKAESQVSEIKIGEQNKEHPPTHDCDDDDMITYVNSLTDEENAAKKESRKKEMSLEDDMFAFVQNPSDTSSSKINSSLPTPSERKINSYSFPFDRIKAVCREKKRANKTLDSDDTLNVSSDFGNSSSSTVSRRVGLEALKKKMANLSNKRVVPDDGRVVETKYQLLNRCLRASRDYSGSYENNVVEITEVKVGSKPEPLIKPISTRYFAKPSTDAVKEISNCNVTNNIPIEGLQKEEVDNSSGNNTSSSTSIEDTSIECASYTSAENKSHQKDEHIDSGFCIKSTANSLSSLDSDETKLDSNIDHQKKNNQVEATNLKSEVTKKEAEIKTTVKSPDYKNDEMDCGDFIDYDAFDVENIELFFPGLSDKFPKEESKHNGLLSIANTSSSSNSDSENPSNTSSQLNFNRNIFENINIDFSTLRTDYSNNQIREEYNNNPTSSLKNEDSQLGALHVNTSNPSSSDNEDVSVLREKSFNQKKTDKEDDVISNHDATSSRNAEESKLINVAETPKPINVAETPKPASKKMQKYRIALENYKNKCKSEAESKEEPVEQQIPLRRSILKEVQKHMHLLRV